jgi:hypothetical protein
MHVLEESVSLSLPKVYLVTSMPEIAGEVNRHECWKSGPMEAYLS